MFIAIGQFKLKEKKQLFKFLRLSKKIEKEALSANGNLSVKLMGGNLTNYYVMSTWESSEALLNFSKSGFHLEAVKMSKDLASEIRLLYFESDHLISASEVKELLKNDNRVRILNFTN